MRSRGANGRSHTSFLSPVPPSKWDTWFGNNKTVHLITRSAQTKKPPTVSLKLATFSRVKFPTGTNKVEQHHLKIHLY